MGRAGAQNDDNPLTSKPEYRYNHITGTLLSTGASHVEAFWGSGAQNSSASTHVSVCTHLQ
jgi:hypothetical protein